jgi:hypothetical protein
MLSVPGNCIADCISDMRTQGAVENEASAEADWAHMIAEEANKTLPPLADSWYMGANILGEPRVFLAYPNGIHTYTELHAGIASAAMRGSKCAAGEVGRSRGLSMLRLRCPFARNSPAHAPQFSAVRQHGMSDFGRSAGPIECSHAINYQCSANSLLISFHQDKSQERRVLSRLRPPPGLPRSRSKSR